MNPKEQVRLALKGRKTDRPLFCPAIYEHKAKLLGKSPSEVSQDPKLLAQAVLAEYETYRPDMLTVGIDIYNVEAEALGCNVLFPEAIDAVPVIDKRVLSNLDGVDALVGTPMVDPERSGRMPLVLEAARAVNDKLGDQIYVRGAISGPHSMAVELMGIEQLLIAMIDQPGTIDRLLKFCTGVSISYGRAFLKRGVEVCVFDSYAAPPLVSPQLYKDLILPHVNTLVLDLKKYGAELLEYVIGGNTSPIAEHLFATGADVVLSDFSSDVDTFLQYARDNSVLVRRNINPILIEQGPDRKLQNEVHSVSTLAAANQNVIIGTGVISYNTEPERVLMVKNMCLEEYRASK